MERTDMFVEACRGGEGKGLLGDRSGLSRSFCFDQYMISWLCTWKVNCPPGCRGHILSILSIYDIVFTVNRSKQACIPRTTVTRENVNVTEGPYRVSRETNGANSEMAILFIQNISAIM